MYLHDEFGIRFLSEEKQWSLTTDAGIKIVPGITVSDGECKIYTLGHKGNVHSVIDAKNNIGDKQDFLRGLIAGCCYEHSPEHLELQVIQYKRTESIDYEMKPEYNVCLPQTVSLAFGESASEDAIKSLRATAGIRYEALSQLGYKDVLSYNKGVNNGGFKLGIIPRRLVIINVADILFEKKNEAVMQSLSYLAKIGRAAGIHIIYVFDNLDVIPMDTMMEGILNQCSLRFTLCGDSKVECRGIEDEASVLCNIPVMESQNMVDMVRSM